MKQHSLASRLFQFHEEQNEDGPYSDGDRKLHDGRIAHASAPGQRVGEQHHGQGREDANDEFAYPVHG